MADTTQRHTHCQNHQGNLQYIQLLRLSQIHTHRWKTTISTGVCKANSIQHELASAHNLESNGQAKAAVKNLKAIVTRAHAEKANLEEAIAAWRNMARADGISPSQFFFNRLPHQKLPIHTDPTPINLDNRSRGRTHVQNISN